APNLRGARPAACEAICQSPIGTRFLMADLSRAKDIATIRLHRMRVRIKEHVSLAYPFLILVGIFVVYLLFYSILSMRTHECRLATGLDQTRGFKDGDKIVRVIDQT